jgi:transposase-like protein
LDELFEGRHFDREIIVLCVRWYLRFKLSFRDLVEMMAERNLSMAHTTIMRWIHHYAPEFERRWNRFAQPAGPSWRVDETYVKIRGGWVYLCRAVDRDGKTVDTCLSTRRDVAAAKAFFRKAIKSQGSPPRTITLDGYAASHRAVRDMKVDGQLPADTKLRSSKYLNNLIEQDHRGVKLRIDPMLGFKWIGTAAITIAGIELLRRIPQGSVQSRQAVPHGSKCACRLERGAGCIKPTTSDGHIGQPCLPVYLHQNQPIVPYLPDLVRCRGQPA